jgi:hypothetical protein
LVLADADGVVGPEEARVWVTEGRLMYHKLTRLTTFATEGPAGGWFILQDGDEIRVGPHRLAFELLAPRGITEALAKLEQSETEAPSILKSEGAAPPVAGRKRKAVETPAAAPEDREDDPVAGQAAAWLKRESERAPEPAPTSTTDTDIGLEADDD